MFDQKQQIKKDFFEKNIIIIEKRIAIYTDKSIISEEVLTLKDISDIKSIIWENGAFVFWSYIKTRRFGDYADNRKSQTVKYRFFFLDQLSQKFQIVAAYNDDFLDVKLFDDSDEPRIENKLMM